MKQKFLLLLIFLVGSVNYTMAQTNSKVTYTAMYRYHHIYCTFLVNNMPIHSSGPGKPVMMSFVGRIGALLAECRGQLSMVKL